MNLEKIAEIVLTPGVLLLCSLCLINELMIWLGLLTVLTRDSKNSITTLLSIWKLTLRKTTRNKRIEYALQT